MAEGETKLCPVFIKMCLPCLHVGLSELIFYQRPQVLQKLRTDVIFYDTIDVVLRLK